MRGHRNSKRTILTYTPRSLNNMSIIKRVIVKPRKERIMSFKASLKQDYKATWEAYKEAKETGDIESMKSLSHELVRIADRMEMED